MKLEERKVLLSRSNIFKLLKEWRCKEWWYTGIHDGELKVYISWYFIRFNLADQITLTIFDPAYDNPLQYQRMMYLDRKQRSDSLNLNFRLNDAMASYSGDEKQGWKFDFKGGGFAADVIIKPTIPFFTKFDNEIVNKYGMFQFSHNRANGTIKTKNKEYKLNNALGYYDHYFGKIPRNIGWNWLAIQNEKVALASFVNYGPYGHRYTQAWFANHSDSPRREEWIRMDQNVSFEQQYTENWSKDWIVSSSDMELKVTPLMHVTNCFRIPPLIPFIVNLYHTEVFVKAEGRIRVDGHWVKSEDTWGVMEKHYGKW
jgi:hypothetical protein